MENFFSFFSPLLETTVLIVEFIAYILIVLSFLKAVFELVIIDKLNMHQFHQNTTLTDGIIGALELLMVAEVLKTMNAFNLSDILTLSVLILLRVLLTYVLRRNYAEADELKKKETIVEKVRKMGDSDEE